MFDKNSTVAALRGAMDKDIWVIPHDLIGVIKQIKCDHLSVRYDTDSPVGVYIAYFDTSNNNRVSSVPSERCFWSNADAIAAYDARLEAKKLGK